MIPLNLYLDDCVYSKRLQRLLVEAGHLVATPFEAGLSGADDGIHLDYAYRRQLILVTKDAGDFAAIHEQGQPHFGILAICEEADRAKNMSYADIVKAINNFASADVPLHGEMYVLNHWRW
ncbi:MAG TPA: DUF5615 family PIN-like protein [Anaerolineae bacterium]|nr:DUF5615 family PIN-like protein [Anaerolineae bacterium]